MAPDPLVRKAARNLAHSPRPRRPQTHSRAVHRRKCRGRNVHAFTRSVTRISAWSGDDPGYTVSFVRPHSEEKTMRIPVYRYDLAVPYAQKDEAKALGARWDPRKKVWFLARETFDEDDDQKKLHIWTFRKWLPPVKDLSSCVRSSDYFLAETVRPCWKCGQETKLHGFLMPPGYSSLIEMSNYENEVQEDWYIWETILNVGAFVSYIDALPDAAVLRVQALSKSYRLNYSKTVESSYWMNHCDRCNAPQGDFHLYSSPGVGFSVFYKEHAERVSLRYVNEPIALNGGLSGPITLIDHMKQID